MAIKNRRIERLNSLLREVISETITKEIQNPLIHPLFSIIKVDVSKDLHYAKVWVSVIGEEEAKQQTLKALQTMAGYIGSIASKKVVLRYFPTLTFLLDSTVDAHMRIDTVLKQIKKP